MPRDLWRKENRKQDPSRSQKQSRQDIKASIVQEIELLSNQESKVQEMYAKAIQKDFSLYMR